MITLISCDLNQGSESLEQPEIELIAENGFFRGYKMANSFEEIVQKETWSSAHKTDSSLVFLEEVAIESIPCSLSVFLNFDTYGLFEIQVDAYPEAESQLSTIRDIWSDQLTNSFGQPDELLFSKQWTTTGADNRKIEVSLSIDELDDDGGLRFVSLNYFEPMKDAY